jgi:hypothetical protein
MILRLRKRRIGDEGCQIQARASASERRDGDPDERGCGIEWEQAGLIARSVRLNNDG